MALLLSTRGPLVAPPSLGVNLDPPGSPPYIPQCALGPLARTMTHLPNDKLLRMKDRHDGKTTYCDPEASIAFSIPHLEGKSIRTMRETISRPVHQSLTPPRQETRSGEKLYVMGWDFPPQVSSRRPHGCSGHSVLPGMGRRLDRPQNVCRACLRRRAGGRQRLGLEPASTRAR